MFYHNLFEVTSCSKCQSDVLTNKQFVHLSNKNKNYLEGIKNKIYCDNLMFVSDIGEFKVGDCIKINIEKL